MQLFLHTYAVFTLFFLLILSPFLKPVRDRILDGIIGMEVEEDVEREAGACRSLSLFCCLSRSYEIF
jgi:hypothetical protein